MKRKKKKLEINVSDVDLLNTDLLKKFLVGEGKSARIISRYLSGLPRQSHAKVAKAIKRARSLNLL